MRSSGTIISCGSYGFHPSRIGSNARPVSVTQLFPRARRIPPRIRRPPHLGPDAPLCREAAPPRRRRQQPTQSGDRGRPRRQGRAPATNPAHPPQAVACLLIKPGAAGAPEPEPSARSQPITEPAPTTRRGPATQPRVAAPSATIAQSTTTIEPRTAAQLKTAPGQGLPARQRSAPGQQSLPRQERSNLAETARPARKDADLGLCRRGAGPWSGVECRTHGYGHAAVMQTRGMVDEQLPARPMAERESGKGDLSGLFRLRKVREGTRP
jgi:hypothetical protein